MKYRHEIKHEINYADYLILKHRLPAIMKVDDHAIEGKYIIRSLYFDTPEDKALREKIDGVNFREKFRIRYYNNDLNYISLEKKSKLNGLCSKEMCELSKEEVHGILDGDVGWMLKSNRPLCRELYTKINTQRLAPKTIVDYIREPYVFGPGNVRVTIDYGIRTGDFRTDFLNPSTITLPVAGDNYILEVKWDEFLPDIIRDTVMLSSRSATAFSKYAACRVYG